MSSVRLRRLQSDYERLVAFTKRQPRLRLIQSNGQPPEQYQLEYHIKSLRQVDDQLKLVIRHVVEISLPRNYPRTPPQCRMLTPVFHPNIAPHAICIGDHWSAGEPLWAMVARIGEMISYQSYNTKSPLNGEAARWVEQNLDRLPLDPAPMYIEEPAAASAGGPGQSTPMAEVVSAPNQASTPPEHADEAPSSSAASTAPSGSDSSKPVTKIPIHCPQCGARYLAPLGHAGKGVLCRQCQTVIPIPRGPHQP